MAIICILRKNLKCRGMSPFVKAGVLLVLDLKRKKKREEEREKLRVCVV